MVTADLLQRSIDEIARLSSEPRDLAGYWRECTGWSGRSSRYWTLLVPSIRRRAGHQPFPRGMVDFRQWLANWYCGDDVNQMAGSPGRGRISTCTGHRRRPARSRRWRFNQS
jgi:hypothetical protein